ncbi:DUF6081 family protein [Streptomyces sp. NBC_01622]|uniref:DUF6081 family protein n=1 Tax=Streptomyces sp. NBC_01622 TaxID=2975903 RepID=UPI003868ED0F|nr:DUF6081 family protein [Streptomyces sp. NBC_01622]
MTYTRHSGTGVSTDVQDESVFVDEFRPAGPDREPAGLPPGWLARPAAGLAAGDGIARVTPEGLVVAPPGRDPATGRPRFAAPASSDAVSHLRWVAFAGTATPPGFALRDGSVLTAHMELAAEIYGPAVRVPVAGPGTGPVSGSGVADTRAGMGGMLCVDLGSGLVLDFLLTNDRVWVLYERLGRPGTGHGTFTYEIPVAERSPDRRHQCAVRVDRARGTAVWSLDGEEVLAVPDLGRRLLSRSAHLTRSADGPDESVRPDRLALGIGLFSEIPEFSGVRVTVRRATVSRSAPTR